MGELKTTMAETILVTGGAGFIGSHTIIVLADAGYKVVVFDNFHNSHLEAITRAKALSTAPDSIHFMEGNICCQDQMDAAFAAHPGISMVVHFAGLRFVGESKEQPWTYYHNNLTGSLTLFKAMEKAGCKSIVFSSSGTTYGEAESPLVETMETGNGITNPYSFTKYVIERMLKDLHYANPSMKVVILRYFNPVGAHESGTIGEDPCGVPTSLFPYALQVLVGRRPKLVVFGDDFDTRDGTCIRDYVHVCDVARGHLDAVKWATKAENAEGVLDTFNFGTGTGSTVLEVVEAMQAAAGKPLTHEIGPRRHGDLASTFCNPDKAKLVLGWEPKFTLAEMCASSWNWQSQNPQGYEPAAEQ